MHTQPHLHTVFVIIFHTSAYPFFFQLQESLLVRPSVVSYKTAKNVFCFYLESSCPSPIPFLFGPFPLNRPECVRHTGLTKG